MVDCSSLRAGLSGGLGIGVHSDAHVVHAGRRSDEDEGEADGLGCPDAELRTGGLRDGDDYDRCRF